MKLTDFEFNEGNHFVAMEYYGLILNRTFLVIITNDYLIGLKVNGLVSVEGNSKNSIANKLLDLMVIKNDLENPYSYMKDKYLDELADFDIYETDILEVSDSNFKIKKSEITEVVYDKRKKWGMGYYPHDGKVYVKTANGKQEFIILGNQSGQKIKDWIAKLIR